MHGFLVALLLAFLAGQGPAPVVLAPIFLVWGKCFPPGWGVGGPTGIVPVMINAERLLFGTDLCIFVLANVSPQTRLA